MEPKQYTLENMIMWLEEHFRRQDYDVVLKYSDRFKPARVPLYCKKEDGSKTDEVVIDLTTDRIITKDLFLPTREISGVIIEEASPVRFYQYYFVQAKVYFAFPDYVEEDEKGFEEFKKTCADEGVGLLRTSATKIEEIIKPHSMFDIICKELGIKKDHEKIDTLEYHLRNCLHYFVYYPESIFRKRAITYIPKEVKEEERHYMKYELTDLVGKLKNVVYKDELKDFSDKYRDQTELDDCIVAEKYVKDLWKDRLGLNYPEIHKRVENILLRDKVYREHFVHQFQVFLIGSYILDSFYSKISQKFKEKYNCEIEKVWLAASTFHDFSYGLQNFDTWLMHFFEDVLRVKHNQTKDNLNLLNLDAAMIREALYDNIIKIVNHIPEALKKNQKEKLIRFFYEKVVRDRNHGILSAISLLQLYYDDPKNVTINEKGILQAAVGIGIHDEDIWEALCGCQGYRRSAIALPLNEERCNENCNRTLWSLKQSKIFHEKLSYEAPGKEIAKYKCERWEKEMMNQRTMEKIRFEKSPILFLLIFCDAVQDDGRIASSDELVLKDRSSLKGIDFDKKNNVYVNLESAKQTEKEDEIERVAWCLKDVRFRVKVNDKLKIMNGSGGE